MKRPSQTLSPPLVLDIVNGEVKRSVISIRFCHTYLNEASARGALLAHMEALVSSVENTSVGEYELCLC